MVLISPPPPQHLPNPLFFSLPAGDRLIRIFDPSIFHATAVSFRSFGPLGRFDHHRGMEANNPTLPDRDPDRSIYYAALTFSGCLVEVFGDAGVVEISRQKVAAATVTRDLKLLDLRGAGAMRAGSVAALSKVTARSLSQEWSRYFYDREDIYTKIDGLIYFNAHNDEVAIALYERAADALTCPPEQILSLGDEELRTVILHAAIQNHLIVMPY